MSVEIFNLALQRIGDATLIDINDTKEEGNQVRVVWPLVRDIVFREHPWSCLLKRVTLAPLSTAPAFEYKHAYELPSDFVRLVHLFDAQRHKHEREGSTLLTDFGPILRMQYVARIEDSTKYDPLLKEVLAVRLAMQVAFTLTKSTETVERLKEEYRVLKMQAAIVDSREASKNSLPDSYFVEAVDSGNGYSIQYA